MRSLLLVECWFCHDNPAFLISSTSCIICYGATQLQYSIISSCFWSIIICTWDACLRILIITWLYRHSVWANKSSITLSHHSLLVTQMVYFKSSSSHLSIQARSVPSPVLLRSQPNTITGIRVENGTSISRVTTIGPKRSVLGRTVLLFFSARVLLNDHTCREQTKKCRLHYPKFYSIYKWQKQF